MKNTSRGGRKEYRAILTHTIEPQQLGLAGALQLARIDRRIGAKSELHSTWLVSSRAPSQWNAKQWLAAEQARWGIENRTHHTLDVTHREDECKVRHPGATTILGIFSTPLQHLQTNPGPGAAQAGSDLTGLDRRKSFQPLAGHPSLYELHSGIIILLQTECTPAPLLAVLSLMQPCTCP